MSLCCRLIAQMRKWADTRGGGGPFPNAGPPAPLSKEQAIDRLHQHTLGCPSCSAVSFPCNSLLHVSQSSAAPRAFSDCVHVTSADLPKL